jgi:hypothetical protein
MDPDAHFHIRWANGRLDWEAHKTCAEAEVSAKWLAGWDEEYTIERCDEPVCLTVTKQATA